MSAEARQGNPKERKRQAFGPDSDKRFRLLLLMLGCALLALLVAWYAWFRSPRYTAYNVAVDQPIPFSHRHHARQLGIDCRYCHAYAGDGPNAGLPSSQVCWTCHSQIFTKSPLLEPLRRSVADRTPIRWQRVTDLKDVVYFDHSAHISKGVRCQECHGDVADMALTYQAEALTMRWCLDCHRAPEQAYDPAVRVAATDSVPERPFPPWQVEGASIPSNPHPLIFNRTDCTTCHR